MSFLKIGDRAAGAIKSGGTTRRAAKMVVLDLDHPDIEEFVNWKVVEEEKVAALVTGSRLLNRHLNAILKACHRWPNAEERLDRTRNADLRKAIAEARAALVPANYIERVLQLASQGFTSLQFEEYDTDWNSKAYFTVSGQNSNNSVRIDNAFMEAVQKDGPWHLYWRTEKEKAKREGRPPKPRKTLRGPRPVGPDRLRRLGLRRPGRAVRHHHQRMAHLPGGRPDQCVEPVQRIHVPRRHRLQSRVAEPAQVLRRRRRPLRRRLVPPRQRLWTLILEISVYMAQFPSMSVAQKSYDFRTLGLGYANLGSLLMVQGIPYDSPEGRAQCGAVIGPDARGVLRHVGGDRRRGRAVPALSRPTARPCCASSATIAAPPTTRRSDEYEGLTITPVGIDERYCPRLPARGRPHARATAWSSWARSTAIRNAQVTCIAPTGTIGLVMDCDTTGVEPDFALVKFKKLAGGGYFKIINASIPPALARLGYTPKQIDDIVRYCRGAGTLHGCPHINPASLQGQGLPRRRAASASRRSCRASSSCRSPSTAGRVGDDVLHRARSASPRSRSRRPASTC